VAAHAPLPGGGMALMALPAGIAKGINQK